MGDEWDWPTDDRRIIIEFHRDMEIRDETISRIWEAVSEFVSTEFGSIPISFGCRVEPNPYHSDSADEFQNPED